MSQGKVPSQLGTTITSTNNRFQSKLTSIPKKLWGEHAAVDDMETMVQEDEEQQDGINRAKITYRLAKPLSKIKSSENLHKKRALADYNIPSQTAWNR
jgi:hypothetical protein